MIDCDLLFISSIFPVDTWQSSHAIIQAQSCWMFTLIHNGSLLIHKCSPHIHFGSENKHENDSQANTGCDVVRLCTLMSYDYRCSCRTFIATHVVRHDNLIKTALRYSWFSLSKYTKHSAVPLIPNRSLENQGYSFQFLSPFGPKTFPSYVRITTKILEMIYSS